jgi:hypothetical protein
LAARKENAKCELFYSREMSALDVPWEVPGWSWCNPPYSRGNLEAFTAKARRECERWGWRGVLLVPATVGAGWFQKNVLRGHDVIGGGSSNPASPLLDGYDLRLQGNNYFVTVRFLRRRVGFWKDGKPMPKNSSAKTDSCLIEWRPALVRL